MKLFNDFIKMYPIGVTLTTDDFARLKCIIKYHKKEASKMARYIAASKDIWISNLAIRLNKLLGYLVPSFEGLWTKMLIRANAIDSSIPTDLPSWVAVDSTCIADLFRKINRDVRKTDRGRLLGSTWDFSTLYTTLPHDLICAAFNYLFDKVFAGHTFLCYNIHKAVDRAYFIDGPIPHPTPKHLKGWRYISLIQIKATLEFLIKNTYVLVGDKLFSNGSASRWVQTLPYTLQIIFCFFTN